MMDSFQQSDGTIGFRNVRITDLEDAVVLPPGSLGLGKRLSGNQFWRSPEAWARAVQNTPADIFSFGIVVCFRALFPHPLRSVTKLLTSSLPLFRLYMSGWTGCFSSRTRRMKLPTPQI